MPDNYSQWEAYEAEIERRLEKRPVCHICREHIQDEHYFYIFGRNYCEDCMNEAFRRLVEVDYFV